MVLEVVNKQKPRSMETRNSLEHGCGRTMEEDRQEVGKEVKEDPRVPQKTHRRQKRSRIPGDHGEQQRKVRIF